MHSRDVQIRVSFSGLDQGNRDNETGKDTAGEAWFVALLCLILYVLFGHGCGNMLLFGIFEGLPAETWRKF